jgi:hypothetical protein
MRNIHWKYKNTTLLLLSVVLLILFVNTEAFQHFLIEFGLLGYPGAFIIGIFFVSIFTVAPATVVLFYLAREFDPILVAIFATFGSILGDYVIFRFLKNGVFEELEPVIVDQLGKRRIHKLLHTPHFSWLLPIVGAIIIASPLPDEAGIALLGLSSIKPWQFIVLVGILDFIGLLVLVATARLIML